MNFVLCCTPVNNLEHPCHYVGSQTALDPAVLSTNLLCYSVDVFHPYATILVKRVQSNTVLQRASSHYETLNFL